MARDDQSTRRHDNGKGPHGEFLPVVMTVALVSMLLAALGYSVW